MKKKLLALAVAGAFVAPVAMADTANVTMYGQMNAAYSNVDPGSVTGGASGQSVSRISSDSSRIGFKGTEDLGGGLNAIWQIESGINVDNNDKNSDHTKGAGAWNSRNTFVGLSGESWGSLVLGNNDSTYKSAFRGYDVFFDTLGDNRAILENDARNASSVTYNSPDFSGVKLAVQIVAGAETATGTGNKKGNDYNMAGTYNAGPISAAVGFTSTKFGDIGTGSAGGVAPTLADPVGIPADSKKEGFRIGGGYKMDAITVNAIYEGNKFRPTGFGDAKWNTLYLAGKFAVSGSDAVKVALTQRGKMKYSGTTVADTKARQLTVGFDHAMSKRTTVYALYSKIDNENGSHSSFNNTVTNAAVAATGAGADPKALSLGIKHSF